MTDLNTLTKAAINALLATPLTTSQLKKTSHADLVAMFDAMPAADALDADLRAARADDTPPTAPEREHAERAAQFVSIRKSNRTPAASKEKPAKATRASKTTSPNAAKAKTAPAPKTNRKPGADVILFLPAEAQKEPKAGSKRATIIDLLRAPTGATVEDIAAATGWSRSVAQSALWVDVKGLGHGVERKDGRLFLLPGGVK